MTALETLKMLLGITGNEQDSLLSFLLDDVENAILGYCNIDTIPTKLESLVPTIAVDMYKAKGYGTTNVIEDVKSISEGNRSVSIETNRPTDSFLSNYYRRLNPFKNRKGRVPSELL